MQQCKLSALSHVATSNGPASSSSFHASELSITKKGLIYDITDTVYRTPSRARGRGPIMATVHSISECTHQRYLLMNSWQRAVLSVSRLRRTLSRSLSGSASCDQTRGVCRAHGPKLRSVACVLVAGEVPRLWAAICGGDRFTGGSPPMRQVGRCCSRTGGSCTCGVGRPAMGEMASCVSCSFIGKMPPGSTPAAATVTGRATVFESGAR
jgi:hypothetical protein